MAAICRLFTVPVLVALTLVGCSGRTDAETSSVESDDGRLTLHVSKNSLPAGVSVSDLVITAIETDAQPQTPPDWMIERYGASESLESFGLWRLEPDGLEFEEPVEVEFSVDAGIGPEAVEFILTSGEDFEFVRSEGPTEDSPDSVTARISHFSQLHAYDSPWAGSISIDAPEDVSVGAGFFAYIVMQRQPHEIVRFWKRTNRYHYILRFPSNDPWTVSLEWTTGNGIIGPDFHSDLDINYLTSFVEPNDYICRQQGRDWIDVVAKVEQSAIVDVIDAETLEKVRDFSIAQAGGTVFAPSKDVNCVPNEHTTNHYVPPADYDGLRRAGFELTKVLSALDSKNEEMENGESDLAENFVNPNVPDDQSGAGDPRTGLELEVPDFLAPTVPTPPTATPTKSPELFYPALAPGTYQVIFKGVRLDGCRSGQPTLERAATITVRGLRDGSESENQISIHDGNANRDGKIDLDSGEFSVRDAFYSGVLTQDFVRNASSFDATIHPRILLSAKAGDGCLVQFDISVKLVSASVQSGNAGATTDGLINLRSFPPHQEVGTACGIPESKWIADLTGPTDVFDLLSLCVEDLMQEASAKVEALAGSQVKGDRSSLFLLELADTLNDAESALAQFTNSTLEGVNVGEEGKIAATKAEWDSEIEKWGQKLSSIGDDAQLANIDLQNATQQQQQTLQTISNVSKMLHDTAMAVIRKIG